MNLMETFNQAPKRLVLGTLISLLAVVGAVILMTQNNLPEGVEMHVETQPTIGFTKAKVNVVVFEEPKCVNCKEFTTDIFPKIKEHYIDTGKITFTVVPVSFLPNSMPAAIALLCVYYADPLYPNPELFFKYLHYIYHNFPGEGEDWATPDRLTKMAAETSPAINISSLNKCIEMENYRIQIRKNTEYGKKLLGGTISTPSVFVNGILVESITYDHISHIIDEVLEREGVSGD
jgi:protein-disulfide isomerase